MKDNKQVAGPEFWEDVLKQAEQNEGFPWVVYEKATNEKEIYSAIVEKRYGDEIRGICKANKLLIYTFLVSAIKISLSKYLSQEDITIGIPCYNSEGKKKIVLNKVLPLTSCVGAEMTYLEYMMSIKDKILDTYKNQSYLSLALNRNEFQKDIMDVADICISMSGLHDKKHIEYINNSSKNALSFLLELQKNGSIKIDAIYNKNKIPKTTVEVIAKILDNIVVNLSGNYKQAIRNIKIVSEEENYKILHEFNDTHAAYPDNKTIYEIFETQAEKHPENIAVVFENEKITYRELDERSNGVAKILQDDGVVPDSIVGIIVDKSIDTIAGILGIIKAGGAYLPLDINYPHERIKFMLEDTSADIILTQAIHVDGLKKNYGDMNIIDLGTVEKECITGIRADATPSNLAYVIYTSGSTGIPKGVMVEHKNVTSLVKGQDYVQFEAGDKILQTGTLAFDASTFEVWGALLNGLTLYLADENTLLDVNKFEDLLKEQEIDILWLTSGLFSQFASERASMFSNVKYLLAGGDILSRKHVDLVRSTCENLTVINGYGPTENTTFTTTFKVENAYDNEVPIGKPLNNSSIYILGPNNSILPIGVAGELCASGDGLSRGYLNNQQLTEEKFVANPYLPEQLMYRTGDLCRWLPDGNIEFLGRMDKQVKIRGYRIELGEVENQIKAFEKVKDAVVVATGTDAEKQLSAYIVANDDCCKIEISEVRNHLSGKLPDYMIPSWFTEIKEIPLTSNGKVDRKALLSIKTKVSRETEITNPRNKTDEKLIEIFLENLGTAEPIGITENFFDIGGDSLKAVSLVATIKKAFNADISLMDVFKNPTVRGISDIVQLSEDVLYKDIEAVADREYYPMSSAQKRMYIVNKMDRSSITYNMPTVLRIRGTIDREKLKRTFDVLVERHESLRTVFKEMNNSLVQQVLDISEVDFEMEFVDGCKNDFVRPFDLENGPLFRSRLVKISSDEHLLMVDMHHIISDGVSLGIFAREFAKIYSGETLESLKLQYRDYSVWQSNLFEENTMSEQKAFWLEQFEGEIPVLNLSTDYKRPTIQEYSGDTVELKIERSASDQLRKLSKETGTTLYMVMLATLNVLLKKYTGQEDIVIGSPIAGRSHDGLDNIIGMFVNTLPMRNYPMDSLTFLEFLGNVREKALNAYENQDMQFEELVENLSIARDMSRNPLFDVMFTFSSMEMSRLSLSLDGSEISSEESGNDVAKFDLTFGIVEENERLSLSINYATSLFNSNTISQMGQHYVTILEEVLKDPNQRIKDIKILSQAEEEQILVEFNDNYVEYPRDKTIDQLFREQALATPGDLAVVCGNGRMTYKELDEYSDKVASTLRESGVMTNEIISIEGKKSVATIGGIIGILKAGCAYLPIDMQYPIERIKYMLSDANVRFLLSHNESVNNAEGQYGEITFVDLDLAVENIKLYEESATKSNPTDLAYVIFTSGSTGRPKGAMIEHRNVVNLVKGQDYVNFEEGDKILQTGSLAFDASTFEIWGALLNGLTLHLADEDILLDIEKMERLLKQEKIDLLWLTSGLFSQFAVKKPQMFSSLKYLLAGGDVLSAKHVDRVIQACENLTVVNGYGPTENTTFTATYQVEKVVDNEIPIGKPLNSSQIIILDSNSCLQPIGVPGELCVSGDGLGRGYLNNTKLTEEKFVCNPYNADEMMYRTGDSCKWLPDGNISFLGRIDNQVKIRGYRIELGEIENQIQQLSNIKDATVAVFGEGSDKGIYAYVIYESDERPTVADMRLALSTNLPEYMVPNYFIEIDEIPVTRNGKIDRKALSKLKSNIATGNEYEAARNEIEAQLVSLWEEVLGTEKISITDNFFELGGHSLKATVLTGRIHKTLNVEVPIRELFKSPTIKGLSKFVRDAEESAYSKIVNVEARKYYEASSSQKRMYMLQQFEPKSTAYNMPMAFEVEGEISKNKIQAAFQKLVERHESLRTCFKTIEGQVMQQVKGFDGFVLTSKRAFENIEIVEDRFVQPFDLANGPLFRAELVEGEEKTYLLIDMHHIISDGVSMAVLINEFGDLYSGKVLEPLKLQYKDFAVWQNEFLKSDTMKAQEKYWLDVFADELPVIRLPYDYDRPVRKSFEGDTVGFEVSRETTEGLKRLSKMTGTTMHMILLSAFNIVLSKYSGQEDIIVGTPISGRVHADVQNIMGMFVNTLALRNKPQGNKRYIEFLKEVKENALKAYENQSYQFESLVDKLNIERDTSRSPLIDVMFNIVDTVSEGEIGLEHANLKQVKNESKSAKMDLALSAFEAKDTYEFSFEYSSKLFNKATIERLSAHYAKVLEKIIENTETKLCEIEILSEVEKNQILLDFNDTKVEYPQDKTMQALFEEQAERTPNDVAVISSDKQLTYRELNEKANALARKLRVKGVKSESVVGIMVDRTFEMIIGIMGIMKAGGAYLPIDPSYPTERKEYMLEDSGCQILLTVPDALGDVKYKGEILELFDKQLFEGDVSNLEKINSARDLAYVIYTSGTTGNPKGVMIEHHSLAETLLWRKQEYGFSEQDVVLPVVNYVFDGFVTSFFTPIISGSKVILVGNEEMTDVSKLKDYFNSYGVTHYVSVPSLYVTMMTNFDKLDVQKLKVVTLAGEEMPQKAIGLTKSLNANTEIINEYGPTENTVITTIMRAVEKDKKIYIGKPAGNTDVYIVDAENRVQPIGIPGELCIGGSRLARGYLNRPELNEKKFIQNPFKMGERIYKTGDLARWLPDGNIDYLGRIDGQVKIRGHRIEIGEIENKLQQYEEIVEVAVVVKENFEREKYLCAYGICDKDIDISDMKSYLKSTLPEYMIPSSFVQLEKMPLTPNGKIDRKALSDLEECVGASAGLEYVAPSNDVERALSQIWSDLLGVEKVGSHDNFFDLGGNSLNSITLAFKINELMGAGVSAVDVFNNQSISELAEHISNRASVGANKNRRIKVLRDSGSKKNMIFIHDGSGEITSYIKLAHGLNDDYNYIGIDAEGLLTDTPRDIDMEEIAKNYIGHIKEYQDNGPYYIAGWSIGGTLGFEICRQLEAQGENVEKLVLIDSYLSQSKSESKFEVKDEKAFLSELLNIEINENYKTLEALYNGVQENIMEIEGHRSLEKFSDNPVYMLRSDWGNYAGIDLLKRINIARSLIQANNNYFPQGKVRCSIDYIKAMGTANGNHKLWMDASNGGISYSMIEGDHFSIFQNDLEKLVREIEKE